MHAHRERERDEDVAAHRHHVDEPAARTRRSGGPSPSPEALLALQRTVGNAAVTRMMAGPREHTVQRSTAHAVQRQPTRSQTASLPPTEHWYDHDFWDERPKHSHADDVFGGKLVEVYLAPGVRHNRGELRGSDPYADACTIVGDLRADPNELARGWVKGHLLSQELGGEGKAANLTPLTARANRNHDTLVEEPVKEALDYCRVVAQRDPNLPVWYGVYMRARVIGESRTVPPYAEGFVGQILDVELSYCSLPKGAGGQGRPTRLGPAGPRPGMPNLPANVQIPCDL